MKPLVSILMPCWNGGPWLAEALNSALSQTWPNKEIVLVDDGSTDGSLAVARSFARDGIRIIAQSNRGAAAARNRALAESRGEFIQYLDADDLLDSGKISAQLAEVDGPDRIYSGRWGRFHRNPAEIRFDEDNPLLADLEPRQFMDLYCHLARMIHPAAWLIPRRVAERAGPWNEELSLNDDGEYFSRVVLASSGIRFVAGAVSLYRDSGPGRLSGKKQRRHLESAFRAAELIASRLPETDPGRRSAAAALFQRYAYDYYPAAPDLVRRAERRARDLGGAVGAPPGGRGFGIARRLIGWKAARRLQVAIGKFPGRTADR